MGVKVGTGLVWLDIKYLRERWRSVLLKTLEKIGGHN
jgi:hypothetical protein